MVCFCNLICWAGLQGIHRLASPKPHPYSAKVLTNSTTKAINTTCRWSSISISLILLWADLYYLVGIICCSFAPPFLRFLRIGKFHVFFCSIGLYNQLKWFFSFELSTLSDYRWLELDWDWMKKVDPNICSAKLASCVLRFAFFQSFQVWRILGYFIFVVIFWKNIYNGWEAKKFVKHVYQSQL